MNFWDWLNDNAGAAQVLFAGLLAAVTGIYAWRTHVMSNAANKQAAASLAMSEEMREQRFEAARPVVALDHRLTQDSVGMDPTAELSIRNIGPGVALSIEYGFSHPRFAYASNWQRFLGPGEKTGLKRLTRQVREDKDTEEAGVGTLAAFVVTYEDVHGRLFETRVELEQNYIGWTERGTRCRLIEDSAPQDRGPASPNEWRTYQVTPSGSLTEVPHDP